MSASRSEPSNVEFAPGTVLGGKYRIDGFLGAGGMGVVLSATHLELDAPVAIKVVRDELAQDQRIVSRLLFEARAAARMRGTHVVRVLDVARLDSGAPYIVMERLEGSDLHDVLEARGALSVHEAVCHVLQACEGLAEAHGLGIIHRDLKPENLFLANTPEGAVLKILDFGISKDIGAKRRSGAHTTLTKEGMAIGSPYYMSPEQMRASPNLDARSDIWALGAILFELLTNQCPFEADSPARLCAKVMCEEAPSLLACSSTFPAALDAIVRRCLQKEADSRFRTVTELADALRAFSAGEEPAVVDSPRFKSELGATTDPVHSLEHLRVADQHRPQTATAQTLLQLTAVCALLTVATVAFWRLQIHPDSQSWLSTRRAVAAEPARPAAPTPETPAPVEAVARPSAEPASPQPSSPAAALPTRQVPRAPAPPRAVPAPPAPSALVPNWARAEAKPVATVTPDPNNPATRYGL